MALDQTNLRVPAGELMALLGPSGCGKTTTLRLIAGFEMPDTGRILVGGRDLVQTPTNRRGLGMVFQNYSLFPHMSVGANVAFGLQMTGVARAERDARVRRMLDLVQLGAMEDRYPNQLSGGQQQRVALARSLVTNPSLLLLDEPLAALDKNLREAMQFELRRIQNTLGITTVMVTHDQEEALTLADRVAVMSGGKVLQVGTPQQVYDFPTSRFVSEFLGTANLFDVVLQGAAGTGLVAAQIAVGHAPMRLSLPADGLARGRSTVTIAVRPEKIRLSPLAVATPNGDGAVAEITGHVFRGAYHAYELHVPGYGATLFAYQQAHSRQHDVVFSPGERVHLAWDPQDAIILDDPS